MATATPTQHILIIHIAQQHMNKQPRTIKTISHHSNGSPPSFLSSTFDNIIYSDIVYFSTISAEVPNNGFASTI